ncbi:MAG TPA: hypothetical protein VM008_21695 [Phycisphaerae bacterium]|nr:hypothetical protein [Phycisphaerae bacterium]
MCRQVMIALAVSVVVGSAVGWGDVIELKDGRTINGTLVRQGDEVMITGEDGSVVRAKPGDVTKVTLTSSMSVAQASDSDWTRAAAEIRRADDLQTIIEIHQKFLEKYPDEAVSPKVRTSMEGYQKLLEQHGVKFRGRWMPQAQVQVMMQEWSDRAKPALVKYRAGDLRGALEAAKGAIKADGANPDALTIAGLASYRLNMTGNARDYFASLVQNDPSSVLGENNLAVILFEQKRQAESLVHYGKAMQASPDNRFVADNIMEALNSYVGGGGDVNSPAYVNLVRQFQQSESRIETQMARRGMYRYGSTWVPPAMLDRLNGNLQAIKNAMAQLDSQYQAGKTAMAQLDQAIAAATNDYNTTSLNISYLDSLISTSTGDVSSYIAQREDLARALQGIGQRKAKLEAERQNAAASVEVAPDQAAKLKAAYAAALANQFTGVQRMMDWGEAENPPGPTIVQIPSPVPVVLPPPGQMPEQVQQELTDSYQQMETPLGLVPVIGIPVPVRRGGGDHDGRHGGWDHGGRGGGSAVPLGPSTPTLPVAPRMNVLPPTVNGIPPVVGPTSRGG